MVKKTEFTADAHIAQMQILRELLLHPYCTFGDLTRATTLTTDHVTFHIKMLVQLKYVAKVPKEYGKYMLTHRGKEYANRMDTDLYEIEKQPKLTVDLAIEDGNGKFIVQQRKKHPYYGYSGFPTGKIRWGETMVQAGARELMEETGLTAELRVVGVYHKLDHDTDGNLLEDKYMCLIHGILPKGTLLPETESHTNQWMSAEEYKKLEKRMGDIDRTIAQLRSNDTFVREDTIVFENDAF